MKVKELVKLLKGFNQECEVFIAEKEGGRPYTFLPLNTIRCTMLNHVFSDGKVVYATEEGNRDQQAIII